jgi:predicted outer membrane protein
MAGDSGQSYDKNYNLITVLQQSLENVWALSTYIDDAGDDDELKSFFEEVKSNNEAGAKRAKELLSERLGESGE